VNPARWLTFSVVLNLALAGWVAFRLLDSPTAPDSAALGSVPAPGLTVKRVVSTNTVVEPGAIIQQDWRSVEHEDYRKYIASLRAIGCPEETIRDIIILDLNKQFLDRRRMSNPPKPFKFWEAGGSPAAGRNSEARERETAQFEMSREKRALVRELLGVELTEELARYHMSNSRADLENMWGFVSAEKRDAIKQLQAKHADLTSALRLQADPDGRLSPELQQQLRELRVRNEAELAQAMTPYEFEQYQLRMSPTASNVRLALSAFEPTEDEYKRVFPIRKEYDDKYGDLDRTEPEQARQRAEGFQWMEGKIQAVLTLERYAQYQRSRDNDFRDAHVFVKLWELPREKVAVLYELKRTVDARVRELRADQSMEAAARQSALAAVQAQAQQTLKSSLGERVYQGYLRGQGSWLRNLAR
jgi:hypothetical protein